MLEAAPERLRQVLSETFATELRELSAAGEVIDVESVDEDAEHA